MRLINTRFYYLENFQANNVPPYAVLSHRWENNEVSFNEYQPYLLSSASKREKSSTYYKILNFCTLARRLGLDWGWVDTCCIDQTSSAELSETINSMFDWYRWSSLCCIYLSDVRGNDMGAFQKSEWFSRGWTLQELLAPIRDVYFYDRDWRHLGSKRDLALYISAASNIPAAVIYNQALYPINSYSIAQRMSWASKRQTTRPEDIAYCLLGIFSINMPLLYGEGSHAAYHRLQLMIITQSDDESIYAWSGRTKEEDNSSLGLLPPKPTMFGTYVDRILASHPSYFQEDSKTVRGGWKLSPRTFEATNRGIKLKTRLYQESKWLSRLSSVSWVAHDQKLRILPLRCEREGEPLALVVLQHLSQPDLFFRSDLATLRTNTPKVESTTHKIYLVLHDDYAEAMHGMRVHAEVLQDLSRELREKISTNFRVTFPLKMPDLSMMDFDYFLLDREEVKAVFRSSNTLRDYDFKSNKRNLDRVDANDAVLTMDEFRSRLLRANISASWITDYLAKLNERI